MENIITRHCINPEILIHQHDDLSTLDHIKTWNYKEFCEFIDFWKIILVEKYNAQPGQTIYIQCGPNVYYYSAFFAAAELGLQLIIDWPHVYKEDDLADYKVNMFGKIDFIIVSKHYHDPDCITSYDYKRNLMFGKNIILQDEFDTYEIQDHEIYKRMSTTILAKPDDVLAYSFSSGTTGQPKPIQDTHKKIFLTAKRLGRLLSVSGNSVLHTRTLHHGASMCYHFLPGFMDGKEQFSCVTIDKIPEFVERYSINQLFLYLPHMVTDFLTSVSRLNHLVNITTLYQITSDVLPLIKDKNVNFVKSPFGDTTIGLGFFVKTVDQTTDKATYDVTNMGPVLDDFFQVELRNGLLYVASPYYDPEYKTSNDVFELIDGNYYFKGRANGYRINGEWIKLFDLESAVKEFFGPNGATVVIDSEMQKIYLAVWENNTEAEKKIDKFLIDNYSSRVPISYTLRNESFNEFFNSRKIDHSKIRYVCRKKLLEKN